MPRFMARKGGHRALARPAPGADLGIVDPRLRKLYTYWDKERGARSLPARTDIDPAELRFVLGHLILFDVLCEPLQFRVRLQGTELEWWMGGSLTGQTLDALASPSLREIACNLLGATVASRAPVHHLGEAIVADLPRQYESLLLPLARDGRHVNMVLAGVLCRDEHLRS
jgi:hypothetical protein